MKEKVPKNFILFGMMTQMKNKIKVINMSNYAKIKKYDIADGDGVRTSIFFTGCPIHCEGCFNQELQNPKYGQAYTEQTYQEIKETMNEHISGLSILGGEPLSVYNINTVIDLCKQFKKDFPSKTIYLWTGYRFDELPPSTQMILSQYCDTIVDGPFDIEQRDLSLKLRGSRNQRVLRKGVDF